MEAVTNLQTINQAIKDAHKAPKVIAGAGGGGGGKGGSESDDDLESKSFLSLIDLLGEGQIGGLVDDSPKSIFLNDTPLVNAAGEYNFQNVTWAMLKGTQDQPSLGEGFDTVESSTSVGQLITRDSPATFSITDPNADRARVIISTPSLISTTSRGDIVGSSVEYKFSISLNNSHFVEIGKGKITGKTRSRYQRQYEYALPKQTEDGTRVTMWTIKIERVSPESNESSTSNDIYLDSYSVIIGSRLSYPNSAVFGLSISSEQFQSIPTRSYLVDGLLIRVPSNYDYKTRKYEGTWNGTFKLAPSDNPAWILYDVITNERYGLGQFVDPAYANPARLYVIGQYCDEMVDDGFGGKEPRFTLNTVINSISDAYQLISDITSVFNGMAYWSGSQFGYMCDMPTQPTMLYNASNVVNGEFVYSGASRKDMHSVALITWNDPERNYQRAVEYVEDPELIQRYGVRKAEITSFGCTSRGQAHRIGKWLLYTERNQSRTISFKVGVDSSFVLPGDVIQIADPNRSGKRMGGRLIGATATSAILDDEIVLSENSSIMLRSANGDFVERNIKTIGTDLKTGKSVINWEAPLSALPTDNAVWIVKSPELEPQLARVVAIGDSEDAPGTYTITAIAHNPSKFDFIESNIQLDSPNVTIISPSLIEATKNVEIIEEARIEQGITVRNMSINWEQVPNAVSYEVKYKKTEGNWFTLPITKGLSVEIENVYEGEYVAQVVAISSTGSRSPATYSIPTKVNGQASVLPKLGLFKATPAMFAIDLAWEYAPGTKGVDHVEIQMSLDNSLEANFTLLGTYPDPMKAHQVTGLNLQDTRWFRARLVDKFGISGEWSEVVSAAPDINPDKVLEVISGHIGQSDLESALQGKIDTSLETATAAKQASTAAQTAANAAQSTASAAQTAANSASQIANTAKNASTAAQTAANAATEASTAAKNQANTAKATADAAAAQAASAATAAANAATTANQATTDALNAKNAAEKTASDLTTATNQLNQAIKTESDARTTAVSKLNDGITTETSQRKSEDAALLSNIETYKSSTNGTLSSLQTQITTNADKTSANATQINALDSRLTTNESKTNTAISSAATAQTTANTAVSKADAASMSINTLKSTLRVQADALNIDPHFVSGLEYYTIAEVPTGNSVTHGAYGENGSLGIRVIKSNADTSSGTNTNVNTNRTDGFFLKANNTYRAIVRCKLISGTGSILGRFHRKSDNAVLASATLSVVSTSAYVDLIYTYKPTSDVLVYFGTWLMAAGTINYDSISIINATDAVASDANASAITNLTTRVTNAEGTLTSQGNSITQLNNNIVSINGTLASKADATALSSLANRVTTAEGQISSQGSSIVSLQNDLASTNKAVSTKADSSALNSLDSKVSEIDGRVTSTANAVTSLQGSVSSVEKGLSTKADASALNNYYTKTEADSAASGAIDKFNSQLTIGGVNAVANSEAPRTSTAATNREYLLYERSAELKAFYDENLEKPVTISFEMSVPIAGSVQVYSSNGSAHTFVTSVNAVIPNQFIKYSVTVSPKTHTASTTVSTIEFYGTYGTGRIPTIRKLQIEAGTKATAWSPSPRDTKAAIDANASAIQTTQTKVDNIDGRLTTATDSITSLNSRMSTAEGNINSTNTAVGGLSTRMATAEGKITNQSDSIASLQNSVTSINGTLANKADSSAVNNLTSRVETAEGKISSQGGQITSLSNSLDLTNSNLNDVNVLARLLSLGKPLRDDPTFKSTTGGLAAYALQSGSSFTRQAKSTDNPMDSAYEMLLRATTTLGSGWYPNNPTVNGGPNKAFLVKQVIKMPIGQKLAAFNNTLGTGGYVRILGNAEGTGKFETYYSVIQCGPDANTAIQGHFRVINSSNPPVPSASNPVDVILASYEVFDVTAVNDTIPKAYSDAIAANANAINTLSNTVSQQGNTITSHSNSITQLNNSISSINGSLATKADSSAVQSLDSKVTQIDGKVTSNTSALTALQSGFDGLPNQGINLLGPEISNPVEKPTNWVSGLPFEVIQSPDTVNVRAFQFTMPATLGNGTYFNIGGGQVPRQWLTEGKYVFSFAAKTVGGTPPHPIQWVMYPADSTKLTFNITATLTRFSGVFTVPAGGAAVCMLLLGNPTAKAAGQVVNIERIMLERQVGTNTTPSTWIAGSDPTGMIISTQAKATDLFNTATNQNNATAGRVTSLESRMTTAEGSLNKKADATALQNLDTKVTNVDGKVTSNTNAITSLNSALSNATSSISMNAGNAQSDWTFFNTSGEYSIVAQADGQAGRVIQLGNNAGNDIVWMHPNNFIPFDATKTYRLRARYRRRAGAGTIYLGVSQKTPDKALYVTTANALSGDMGSSNYVINAHAPAIDEWQEIVAYIKGRSAGAASGSGSKTSPRTVSQQAGFITPMFIANYSAQTGIVELDYLILEDAEAIVGNDANASAISALDTKVSEVDGRLTTATNSITSLNSRMSAAEGNIASNANAIANTYTKTQTDSAIAGQVNSFKASLQVAGTNLLRNGNFADDLSNWVGWGGTSVVRTIETINAKKWLHLVANNTSIFRGVSQTISANAFKRNTEYTISFNAYSANATAGISVVIHQSGGGNNDPQITPTISITNKNSRYSFTFKSADLDTKTAFNFMIGPQNGIAGDIYITDIMFAEGNVASAWAPSNDQIMGNISANADAINSLSSRVTTAEGYISSQGSSIITLTNDLSTTSKIANAALPKIQGGTGAAKLFRGVLVWQQNGANLTGNIVIQTPITFTNKMFRLSLTGYNYLAAKNEINLNIGGYAYSGTSIIQTGVVNSGTMPIRVRMGVRNGTVVVILTSQAPGAYWQYPKFNIDAEIGYTTPPDSWADGWSASFMAETDLASNGISAIIEPSLLDISTEINANASAISSLSNTVTQQGNTITSHSNSITSLNNSITSINSSLTNKADASALNNLSNRVTAAEGNITSQGNSITSLNNTLTNNDLSNLVLNPDFVDPKSGWTAGVIVDATDAAPNPPSAKALRLNNRDSYYGPFVKCNAGDMFYVSAWFATPNTSATASAVLGFNTRNSAGTYTWYSVAIKSTDKNAWGMVEGYFTVPNGMVEIRPWLQVSIAASEAAGQQWHVTNIQVRNITGNKKLATDLQATSSALSTLDSKVTNIDGRVTSASNNIVSLNNSVTNINATLAQKADATALNSLSNRVTNAEGNITSQGNSITSLTNSLAVSGKGGTNLLIKSNVVGLYDGVSYPHHTYKLGEDWEIGAKYTLIWCAEHKRGTGDNNSYLAVYAGGGSQTLQSIVNTDGKVISKVTFVKNSAVASGPIIHFYMINRPTADKGTIGTVYWAVLVKGDVLTTDAWIPSPYDYIPDSNANAAAIANLTNTVSQQGNIITSNSSSITSLTNQIGNTKSYSLVTFRNGSAVGMPKAAGVYTGNNTRLYGFGRGLNLIVFKNGDVESCTQYDTYGDIVSACNAIYAAIKALASGTYFAIVGTDNIGSVGNSNPNTDLRALLLACGAGDTYFRSWNWNALPIFVGRKDLDAGNGILGMFDSTVPNQWIEYPLSFVNGVPVGLGDSRTLTTQLDANASAISSLSNTVTQQGKDIASHSSSITSLNNSITNINGTLATKADSSALTNLANRVTTTEGAITSQGSSITSLNASVNGLLKDVAVSDTRSTNQPPSWYWSNYPLRIVREFKQASVLGLTGMGTYVSLETYVYWTNASGGPIIQIARGTDSKLTAERRSTSTSTWGSWTQDIKTLSDGLANKAEASAVNTLDAKVSTIDGKVSTQASNIVSLQTAVGGNTSAISEQSKSIDGIRNIKTITIDNNGVMSGYGLISDLVNGKVTSTFGVNADNFYIGPPSGGKKPFLVTTTNTTVNGVTYPPGTWIDTAYIATASIKSAHIQDAAITTAKIADAAIDTAKIKDAAITNAKIADLTVDTIKIKDNAITVATVAENTQASKILTPSSSTFDACQVTVVTSGTNFVKIDVSPFLYAWNKYSNPQIYLDIYRDGTLIKTFNLPWIQSTEVFKDRSWTEGGSYDVLYNIVVYTMNTMAGSMFTTLDRPAAGTHVYKATVRRTTNWGRDDAMGMARRYNEIEFTNALILITEVKK